MRSARAAVRRITGHSMRRGWIQLNASLTALSKQDPTRPMDWKTPSLRQDRRNLREAYSASSTSRCNTGLLQRA